MPRHQPAWNPCAKYNELDWSQATPVQNTYYTVLDARNVQQIFFIVGVAVTGESLQIRVTIDGGTSFISGATVVAANEFIRATDFRVSNIGVSAQAIIMSASGASHDWDNGTQADQAWIKGRDLLIEVRKTTAAGVGDLRSKGVYWLG